MQSHSKLDGPDQPSCRPFKTIHAGRSHQRAVLLVGLIVLMEVAAGCGTSRSTDYSKVDLIDVTGRVTLDGVALAEAHVEFESPDQTSSYGLTDEQGEFRLLFNSERTGCLPGEKIVRIQMPSADVEDPDATNVSGVEIPGCYNTQSILRATVSPQQHRFDFDLTTDTEMTAG